MSGPLPSTRRLHGVGERVVEGLVHASGWSAILFVAAIFVFIGREAIPALRTVNPLALATDSVWRPASTSHPEFGLLALILGTVSVTTLAMAIAVPAGFAAAVFISEFCGPRLRESLKIVIELLAAVPSIVWGFVAYMVLNPLIILVTGAPIGVNVLNGGVILALMSAPIVMSLAEDALKAVPDSYREAALALGASRWQMVVRVLLPAAKNGLLAAALLGVGRGLGETMAVLMATGHSVAIPHSLFDPVRTLTATIAAELGETVEGSLHYRVLFVIGGLLMTISLVINVAADLIVSGGRKRRPV
jgi:phosphate transport system permease protein